MKDALEKTKKAYLEDKLNCAQSVLKGFQSAFAISEERIAAAKAHGGGRAEDGLCGALHSALSLVGEEEGKKTLCGAFTEAAGSKKCREIKKIGRIKCADCVELAARLLAEKATGSRG